MTRTAPSQALGYAALAGAALCVGLLAGVNPLVAVLGTVLVAAVMIVTADLTLGLCGFVLLMAAEKLPALGEGDLTPVKALGLLLALSWIAAAATRRHTGGQLANVHPAFFGVAALFLGWTVLSVAWAEDTGAAWIAALRYGLNLCLLPIVFAAIRRREHAGWVLGAFVVAATLSGLYAIAVAEPADDDGLVRIDGLAGTATELASFLVAALLLAIGIAAAARRRPGVRALALGCAAVCVLGVFLTLSRSGIVAMAAALVAAMFLAGRWRIGAVLVTLLVMVAALGWFNGVANDAARERVTTFSDGGTGRVDIWTVGLRMVRDQPLTGVGAGNFQTSSIGYLLEPGTLRRDEFILDRPQVAHNMYLHVLAEFGAVGLLLFLFLIGYSLACMVKAARAFGAAGDHRMDILARATLLALVGLLVSDFFASDQLNKQLWVLLGLGPALLAIARRARPAPAARGRPRRRPRSAPSYAWRVPAPAPVSATPVQQLVAAGPGGIGGVRAGERGAGADAARRWRRPDGARRWLHAGRLRWIALAAVTLAIAVAGVLAGRTGGSGGEARSAPREMRTGALSLAPPGDWVRRSAASPVPGLPLDAELAIGPPGDGEARLVAGTVDAAAPLIWPPSLRAADWPPARDLVTLSGARAERFRDVRLDGGQRGTLYAVFAAERTYAVACAAPAALAGRFLPACEAVAATLEVPASTSHSPVSGRRYADRVGAIVDRLLDRRRAAERALVAAIGPAGAPPALADPERGRAAAAELAGAFDEARAALPPAPESTTARWRTAIAAPLGAAGEAHRALELALLVGDVPGVRAARADAVAAEKDLRAALSGLATGAGFP